MIVGVPLYTVIHGRSKTVSDKFLRDAEIKRKCIPLVTVSEFFCHSAQPLGFLHASPSPHYLYRQRTPLIHDIPPFFLSACSFFDPS
jgi:hypothetical protein